MTVKQLIDKLQRDFSPEQQVYIALPSNRATELGFRGPHGAHIVGNEREQLASKISSGKPSRWVAVGVDDVIGKRPMLQEC